jgi:hypothetical protein
MKERTRDECQNGYENIFSWSLNVRRQLGSTGGQQWRLLESLRDGAADVSYQLLL